MLELAASAAADSTAFDHAGAFSDGAFAMLPGVGVSLSFTAHRPLSAQQWTGEFADGLRVRSLRDTYV